MLHYKIPDVRSSEISINSSAKIYNKKEIKKCQTQHVTYHVLDSQL